MALFAEISSHSIKQLLKKPYFIGVSFSSLQKSTSGNAIDSFAADLVEEKSLKWEVKKRRTLDKYSINKTALKGGIEVVTKTILSDLQNLKESDLCINVRKLTRAQIDNLFSTSLQLTNNEDFLYLVRECVNWKVLPSQDIIVKCLEKLSFMGKTELIEELTELYKEEDPPTFTKHSQFAPFKGLSLWKNGKLELALEVLVNYYPSESKVSVSSRKLFHSVFRIISEETLRSKSGAVLVCLLKSAEIIDRECRDIFVIGCIWKNCFESSWFSDQQVAMKLFNDYQELRNIVYKRTTSLCYNFLRENNVDAVHRLIELFLKNSNTDACKICLNILFEYSYWRRDLRACVEIIKNSLELDIPLSEAKSEKLLKLLLNQPSLLISKPKVEKFQYKF